MTVRTKITGDKGEDYAVAYLKKQHCKILDRNYRKPFGEIDIVARKKQLILFVEVKTRHGNPFTRPYEAVDHRKQQRILRTALAYIREHHLDLDYRCDVCEVYVDRQSLKLLKLDYYENAFEPEGDLGAF